MKGIPHWRHVCYTDDGCSRYQCLSCKEYWEGRDDVSGRWSKGWKFCPYCGCEWNDERRSFYESGHKHDFIARVYGREIPWPQTPYRYEILEWTPIIDQWRTVSDWYKSNHEFFLIPHDYRSAANAKSAVREKLADLRRFWKEWEEQPEAIKIILERRNGQNWIPINEVVIQPKNPS